MYFVRGSTYVRRLRKGQHITSGLFRRVFGLCYLLRLCNMLDFVVCFCSLGDQYLEHVRHVALQVSIGSACPQQLVCDQLVTSCALCHDHGSI